ncbi:MAG: flagellar basal-body rod protein FlgF [Negativicutes bacterium]|nr:flagellar basal-body rod protein FlgF [Negativicutes bacterium]
MIRGLYAAASGMVAEALRNDTIANNLANANTGGYKKDIAVSKDFAAALIRRINDGADEPVIGMLGRGAVIDEVAVIHTAGIIRPTGNALDAAIEGKGYFAVETPNGLRYTRSGSFSRNAQGELTTGDGYRVMGENGPLRINNGQVHFAEDGAVQVDGIEIGRLQLTEFADEKLLAKEGSSLFRATGDAAGVPASGRIRQGMLEMSNVNVVAEMVNMIAGYRAYEINAKAVEAHDQLLDKAVNEVGRV